MEKRNYNDLIWVYDNSLTPDFCKSLIDKFENSQDKHEGLVGLGRVDKDIKKTTDLLISKNDLYQREDNILFKSLQKGLYLYTQHLLSLGIRCNVIEGAEIFDSGYQIQKYSIDEESKGFYDWHHDAVINKNGARVLTYLWYLNTVKEGGETEFFDGMKIKPKEGTLLIFPACWPYFHRGCEVIKDEKWICTGWVYESIL